MNKQELSEHAAELIGIIKNRFLTKEGLLARNYPPTERTLFDNFDDIVPFLLYFREEEFLLAQVKRVRELGLNFEKLCAKNGLVVTRNADEWFGGLYALWKHTGNDTVRSLLDESIEYLKGTLLKEEYLPAGYFTEKGKSCDFYESWSAGLLETFIEMRDDYPDLFILAQKTIREWTDQEYFKEYRLFPYRIFVSRFKNFIQSSWSAKKEPTISSGEPPAPATGTLASIKNVVRSCSLLMLNGKYSQLMKSNSTPAFTLLELYRTTGDQVWAKRLEAWIEAALLGFVEDGRVFREYIPGIKKRRLAGITPAFILTDVICDAAYFYEPCRSHLPTLKTIIDSQWESRLPNGLIPMSPEVKYAHLDDQIDFSVSMRRYGELTENRKYQEHAKQLTETALTCHYTPDGYETFSGENIPKKVVDPKYNCLALKGIINLLTVDEPLYPQYHALFKDR